MDIDRGSAPTNDADAGCLAQDTGKPEFSPIDALSDALQGRSPQKAFSAPEFTTPWRIFSQVTSQDRRPLLDVPYHYVVEGRMTAQNKDALCQKRPIV